MTGQGRPSSLAHAAAPAAAPCCARPWWWTRLAIVAALLLLVPSSPLSAADPLLRHPAHVRIAWGGPPDAARRWTGRITVDGGTFGEFRLLGMEADAAASVWREQNTIRVDAPRVHRFDGIDVAITASDEDAQLHIELSSDPNQPPVSVDVPLAKALREPFQLALDASGNALLVQRAPGDELRIETARQELIFAPRDTFSFTLRPVVDGIEPGSTIDVETRLSKARGGSTLWSDQQRLPVPVDGDPLAPMAVPLPSEEGVYTIDVAVTRPPGFRDRFLPTGSAKPLAERRFQIVVMRLAAEPPADPGTWKTVLEIDPANPRWWQRLPDWTQVGRLPGIAPRPLGSIRAGAVDTPLGRLVELPPTQSGSEPHWQAYPLPIEKTGAPHLLEIEYPANLDQHLGLSILEPNASGRTVPIGRDSGVYVEGLGRSQVTGFHVHRFVFWPRTNSPLLLVTNGHPTAAARFGRIRVLRRQGSLANAERPSSWRDAQRLVAAYVSRPLVPETFGATEGLDPNSGQSVDDWQTFYEGATRLADYLEFAGYNAAATSVLADGSATFPSGRLLSTPLHHTGRMIAGLGGLPPDDALELALRVFDRRGLALFPTLQLASPLQQLEPLRRAADPQTSGLEWVGPAGRSWLEIYGADRGLAPYYNLLDDRVQQAVENIVREIVDRYGHHQSLAGLAVQLSGDGFAELPGLEWGLDDRTIAQFEHDTGIHLTADGPNRFAARQTQLLGEHRDAWRAWRAARVTQFYRRLAEVLRSADADRRLLLTTERAFSRPSLKAQVRPNVLASVRIDGVLLDLGIDRAALATTPGVVLCATRFVEPGEPLVDRAVDMQISEAFAATARGLSGATLYHRPTRQRMSGFDAKSPLDSYTLLVTQSSPDGSEARRAYAIALDDGDPQLVLDGGELLPLGQEDAVRGVRETLQRLPTGVPTSTTDQQPVTVRRYAEADGTTLLVVNGCPWQASATVSLDVPQPATMEPLVAAPTTGTDAAASAPRALEAGRQTWTLELAPYDVRAVRVSTAGVEVAAVQASVGDAARQELDARLANLGDRDLTAVSECAALANPGFEPVGGGGNVPGWQAVGNSAAATAELDATTPHSGQTCLYLSGGGGTAAVESANFTTPPTGQLAMTVFVRGEHAGPETELRMVFETELDGQLYRRFAAVGGNPARAQPLDAEWVYYAFCVGDLPLDSHGQMRVRFELTGPGEVWIDDVQLYDLLFPLRFYAYSSQERLELVKLLLAARSAEEDGRITECVRLLESYWPRFVTAHTPLGPPAVAAKPAAPAPATPPADDEPEEAPTVGQRLKGYLPSILRF